MKKILALVCSIVMIVSLFAVTANAAVDGAEVTIEFAEYGEEEGYTLVYYDVTVNVPDALAPYTKEKVSLNKYNYSGIGIQGISVELPIPEGLVFLGDDYSEKTFDGIGFTEKDGKLLLVYVNTSTDYTTYKYALGKIARVGFMVDSDSGYANDAEYVLDADVVKIGLTSFTGSGVKDATVTPYEYGTADFTITAGTTKVEEEFVPETKKGEAVAAKATNIELDKDPATAYKNQYLGTAVFTATLGADVNYSEAGFIFAKNGTEGKGLEKMADGNAVTGKGTFEFTVAMYGIPVNEAGELAETITAIPYYITAAPTAE